MLALSLFCVRTLPVQTSSSFCQGLKAELGADHLSGPGLMLRSGCNVGDDHLHSLDLQILGRHRAHFVGHLIPLHWHIFTLNVWDVNKYVLSSMSRADEAMALGPGKILADPFENWSRSGSHRSWISAVALCRQWTRRLSRLWRLLLPDATALSQEGEGEREGCAGAVQRGLRWWWWSIRVSHRLEKSGASEASGVSGVF